MWQFPSDRNSQAHPPGRLILTLGAKARQQPQCPPMPARIRVITEDCAPPQEFLIGNTATIGRTPENTICLASNARVSRQHSLIRCFNGVQYQIMDLGSRNGTYVGEQRVVTPVTLEQGSVIRVSGTELHFEA